MKKILSILTVVLVSVMMVVPAFAYQYNGVELGDFTDTMVDLYRGEYKYVVVTKTGSSTYGAYFSTAPLKVSSGKAVGSADCKYEHYMWHNPNGWYRSSGGSLASGVEAFSAEHLYWSTYDVYTSGGSVYMEGETNFLQVPLAETVLGVAEEQLTGETLPEIHRVMMVVVTVAVGCLASLTVLVLLKKRWFVS